MAKKKVKNNNHDNHKHQKPAFKKTLRFSESSADAVSIFFGSWTFIIWFVVFMIIWIVLNVSLVIWGKWDPYPFILLNFVLSTLAAIQGPVILMSQNRMADIDRVNAKYDYQVNRKAEREIQNMQQDLNELKSLIKSIDGKVKKR